jgi:hypothetical protein
VLGLEFKGCSRAYYVGFALSGLHVSNAKLWPLGYAARASSCELVTFPRTTLLRLSKVKEFSGIYRIAGGFIIRILALLCSTPER